jgi:hypothetical protein
MMGTGVSVKYIVPILKAETFLVYLTSLLSLKSNFNFQVINKKEGYIDYFKVTHLTVSAVLMSMLIQFFLDFPYYLQVMSRIILGTSLRMPLSSSYSLTTDNNFLVYFYDMQFMHLQRRYLRFTFYMQICKLLVSLTSLSF